MTNRESIKQIVMSPIHKSGKLLEIDANGYLVNECDWKNIQSPWLEMVVDLKNGCLEALGDRLHSLYLRGSVPRGSAILGISDLDSLVIIQNHEATIAEEWRDTLARSLTERYPFCQKIEIAMISASEIQKPGSFWQAILQTQSLCIYGHNLQPELPRFKPGIALVIHAFELANDLAETQAALRQLSPDHPRFEEEVKAWCGWITRRMVRTGFELVMEAEGTFTRDLYPCYEGFSRHFPAQEPQMRKALELAVQPSANRDGLLLFLSNFGHWLVQQSHQTFGKAGMVASDVPAE